MNVKQPITILSLLAILLLNSCSSSNSISKKEASSPQALRLAQKLNAILQQQGLKTAAPDVITALYGTTGGLSCVIADDYQQLAGQNMFGSPSIGIRALMDPKVLAYDEAVITTYCPEKLETFRLNIQHLKTTESIEKGK